MDQPTCCHEEDSSAEQDVVLGAVDASDADTQAAQHQQDGAEDGKQAGGSNNTCSHETEQESVCSHMPTTQSPPHQWQRCVETEKIDFGVYVFYVFFLLLKIIWTLVKSCFYICISIIVVQTQTKFRSNIWPSAAELEFCSIFWGPDIHIY